MLTVQDPTGQKVQLETPAFARGGEACVHVVAGHPNVVVKLYHEQVRSKRGAALRNKIDAMSTDPAWAQIKQDGGLSWPRFSVLDAHGNWCGYAMRRAQGQPMTKLAHAMAYREHFPQLDRRALLGYLLTLLDTVNRLHAAGVYVGDYNLANFLCQPGSAKLALIDCDSWQVRTRGQTFTCPVAAPDMLAPELHGVNLGSVERSEASERFAVAILIFKVLMLGRHPYDVVGGASPVENIRNGYFPYGMGGGGVPPGPWYNIWSHLPRRVKEQLIQTFKLGAKEPAQRTPVAQWVDLLSLYRSEIDKGWHESAIKPAQPKSKEYRGRAALSQPQVGAVA